MARQVVSLLPVLISLFGITQGTNQRPKAILQNVLNVSRADKPVSLPGAVQAPQTSCPQAQRAMTVRDSIEMQIIPAASELELNTNPVSLNPASDSPDGRYFFVVSTRGLIAANEIESTIWLFDSRSIKEYLADRSNRQQPSPRALVRMAATSNHEPIANPRWSEDGQSIAFLGRQKESTRHLYIVDVETSKVKQLSSDGQDVTDFDRTVDSTVFSTATPVVEERKVYGSAGAGLPDIQVGTGLSLFDLLYPTWQDFIFGSPRRNLWQVRKGGTSALVRDVTGAPVGFRVNRYYESVLSLSPSGRHVIATDIVKRVPKEWEFYEPAYDDPSLRFVGDAVEGELEVPEREWRPVQYVLVDALTGKRSILVDAPLGIYAAYYEYPQVAWTPDERYVALVNTFMPRIDSKGRPAGQTRPCVAVVEVATGTIECLHETEVQDRNKRLSTPHVSKIEWRAGQELVVSYTRQDTTLLESRSFFRRNGQWIQREVRLPDEGTSISVRQNLNDPPGLVATDKTTGESKQIWDPNPQLGGICLGDALVYHWRDKAGREWTGGLVKPPDYDPKHRYPLVLQTHGFNPAPFLVDGFAPTANAARALASRGIVVLQVAEISTDAESTPREPEENGRAGYESAIEQLAGEGLIDPHKVGIIGFSHTGWPVLHTLINAPQYFQAATLAEADDFSFYTYLMNADYQGTARAKYYAGGIGAQPFGEGLARWIANSPGFNSDKIRAPILFEENSPPALVYSWDLYAELRLQEKPVELLYMRNGEHVLVKPQERLASQEMNVDWFDFWLNNHEDPAPAKAEQYVRWHKLRDLRDRNEATFQQMQSRGVH